MLNWLLRFGAKASGESASPAHSAIPHSNTTEADTRVETLRKRGNAFLDQGLLVKAAQCYRDAIEIDPRFAASYVNLGFVLREMGQLHEAAEKLEYALELDPNQFDALFLLGLKAESEGNDQLALRLWGRLLDGKPDFELAVDAICRIHLRRNEGAEAAVVVDNALKKKPNCAAFYVSLAQVQLHQKLNQEALTSSSRALFLDGNLAAALSIRGTTFASLARYEEAEKDLSRTLQLEPENADAINNYGTVLAKTGRFEQAMAQFDRALRLRPDFPHAWDNKGKSLWALKRYGDASDAYRQLLRIAPTYEQGAAGLFWSNANACDWRDDAEIFSRAIEDVRNGVLGVSPWAFLSMSDFAAMQLQCARTYGAQKYPPAIRPLWNGQHYSHDRVRVAYLSADFHDHATAHLMAELFELHDKGRFSTTAISYGSDSNDAMRKRLLESFDRFIDVRSLSDEEIAALVHSLEIDIAVDLKGYTTDSRPGILAHRPAPVQASYLGHPGTLGLEYIDYVIADRHVIPAEHFPYFSEKVVHLPDTYQANDSSRKIGPHAPTRLEAGLPEAGFVFCCFNNNFKIRPHMFAIWMRLLARVDGSVLWLLQDNADAALNLHREAQSHGVDPSRIVFAQRMPTPDHLARHVLADLFLDTLPYNAHTTASDALLTGLPVITCAGGAFASRVASSLLHAIGLEDLVTPNLAEYEALAVQLATNPASLLAVRTRLATNRLTHPLFDSKRFARHIEAAYIAMWQRRQLGLAPASFSVEPESN